MMHAFALGKFTKKRALFYLFIFLASANGSLDFNLLIANINMTILVNCLDWQPIACFWTGG